MNPFIKPRGVLKGSQRIVVKGDKAGQGKSIPNPQKVAKVMHKVMKAYPNGPANSPKSIIKNNLSSKDGGRSTRFLPQ